MVHDKHSNTQHKDTFSKNNKNRVRFTRAGEGPDSVHFEESPEGAVTQSPGTFYKDVTITGLSSENCKHLNNL